MNAPDTAERFKVQPSISDHFSWLRTRMSVERTLLSWTRTAISLIGFGFTIVQFFQRLQTMPGMNGRQMRPEAPRDLGLALIGTGIAVLGIALWQYRRELGYLWSDTFKPIAGLSEKPHRTPAFFSAIVLLLIGAVAFVSVFFRFL